MFRVLRNKKSFTMIELMIVAVVVAILAVVLIPLMAANRARAYSTEAESGLGTLRTQLRLYYAEYSAFPVMEVGNAVVGEVPGVSAGDLDGTYFGDPSFTVTASTADTYNLTCTWATAAANAPQNGVVTGYGHTTTIDQAGNIVRVGY
ncbi:prepilin-type N-terminal cleavage/methylation domain-containing protein [Candidatus Omnitrophota bacterium]